MSRISDYILNYELNDESYPSDAQQLLWRIEDLHLRLEDCGLSGDSSLTCADLCYALPESFTNQRDIERAITIAEHKLDCTYGMDIHENKRQTPNVKLNVPLYAA